MMKTGRVWENACFFWQVSLKKLQNMKLKKKINIALLAITMSACLAIGVLSYAISSRAIISKTQTMATNLVKQVGLNLDERIDAFSDTSYRLLQTSSVVQILECETSEEAVSFRKNFASAFTAAILQQSSLYSYMDFALLRPNNGVVTSCYRQKVTHLEDEEEQSLLDRLEESVTIARPVNWVSEGERIYFVRRVISTQGKDLGILCFALTDAIFLFVGTEDGYLTNDDIVISNEQGDELKRGAVWLSDDALQQEINYKDRDYYVHISDVEAGQGHYMAVALNTRENGWNIICFLSYEKLLGDLNKIYLWIIVVMAVVTTLAFVVTRGIGRTIMRNIFVIEQGMKSFEAGDFSVRLKPSNYDEIGMLVLQMNYMGMKISGLIEEVKDKEKEKQEAEYRTVLAQINPHFLYNTLGSLRWAAWRKGETETAASMDALVNLLRFTIKRADQVLPLKEELEYIRNYITIEKVRYANAFSIYYEVDDDVLDWQLPGFILQPFVENALIHGLDMASDSPEIRLDARREKDRLVIRIADNGVGMSGEMIQKIWEGGEPETSDRQYKSIGISIVNARLKNYYGDDFEIHIDSAEGAGTVVTIRLGTMIRNCHKITCADGSG